MFSLFIAFDAIYATRAESIGQKKLIGKLNQI